MEQTTNQPKIHPVHYPILYQRATELMKSMMTPEEFASRKDTTDWDAIKKKYGKKK